MTSLSALSDRRPSQAAESRENKTFVSEEPNYVPWLKLEGHDAGVSGVKFSPSGKMLATASADKTVIVWDASSGKFHRRIRGHKQGISGVCWSADSRFLCTASDDTTSRLWDVETGKCLRTMEGHREYVFSVDFSPQANVLVTGK